MNPPLARRRAALSLTLVSALALAAPHARATLPPGDGLPAAPTRWWAPFGDPVLDALVAAAGRNAFGQAAIVQAYVSVRTLQAREALLQRLGEAAVQQREVLNGAEAVPERLLAALDARAAQWQRAQASLRGERARAEAQLATLSRQLPEALHERLAAGAGTLPQVAMDVPFHLPARLEAPAGTLPALQAAQSRAQQAQRLLQAAELSLRAVELRQQAGAESPLAVLEAYQQMVAQADDVAVAQGALAAAWAELLPVAAPYVTPRATAAATPAP